MVNGMYNPIISAVLLVTAIWWVVLAVYTAAVDFSYFRESIPWITWQASNVAVGFLVGFLLIGVYIVFDRQRRSLRLEKSAVRGLVCTLGDVPINRPAPRRSKTVPVNVRVPRVPDDFLLNWFNRYDSTHPKHTALLRAVLQVLNFRPDLPATHFEGGHGGRTLLEHSILVAYMAELKAVAFSYTGLKSKNGTKVMGLSNPEYKFDANDPMSVIVAMAHDIGKIEAYRYENGNNLTGKVVGSDHIHDSTGAQMLARMDEIWDLPENDRQVLLMSVAHYHHPRMLPLDASYKAIDDRTHAVMELLIKADEAAGSIENGAEALEEGKEEEIEKAYSGDKKALLFETFMEMLHEEGRINKNSRHGGIGFKYDNKLYILDGRMRQALVQKIQWQDVLFGDKTSKLTRTLCETLIEKGMLYHKHDGADYGPTRSLFVVDVFKKKQNQLVFAAKWKHTLILKLGAPELHQLNALPDDKNTVAEIVRPAMGEHSARNKNAANAFEGYDDSTLSLSEQYEEAEEAMQAIDEDDRSPIPMETMDAEDFGDEVPAMAGQTDVAAVPKEPQRFLPRLKPEAAPRATHFAKTSLDLAWQVKSGKLPAKMSQTHAWIAAKDVEGAIGEDLWIILKTCNLPGVIFDDKENTLGLEKAHFGLPHAELVSSSPSAAKQPPKTPNEEWPMSTQQEFLKSPIEEALKVSVKMAAMLMQDGQVPSVKVPGDQKLFVLCSKLQTVLPLISWEQVANSIEATPVPGVTAQKTQSDILLGIDVENFTKGGQ